MNNLIWHYAIRVTCFHWPELYSVSLGFRNSLTHYKKQRFSLLGYPSVANTSRVTLSSTPFGSGPIFCKYQDQITGKIKVILRMASSKSQEDIDVEELKKLMKDPEVIIIDVRRKDELEKFGKLPSAINIPIDELEGAFSKSPEEFAELYKRPKPEKNTHLVFSCQTGGRSKKAVLKAKEMGFTNVLNFAGGWVEWEKQANC